MTEEAQTFLFNDTEISILNNFQAINPSIIMKSGRLGTVTDSNTVFGFYDFDKDKNFKDFGIYELNQFITILKEMGNPVLTIEDRNVIFTDTTNNSFTSYRTTPINSGILKEAKYPSKAASFSPILEMIFRSDASAQLKKIGDIINFQCVYIEPFKDVVKFIGADTDRLNTENVFEVVVNKNDVITNNLQETLVIKRHEFNMLLAGHDYDLKIIQSPTENYLSQWNNKIITSLEYFVGIGKEN